MPGPIKFPHKVILQRSILKVLNDGELHHIRDIRDRVAADLKITAAALSRQYKGESNAFEKRMNNILTETKDGGLIESPKRGHYQLCRKNINPPLTEAGVGARVQKRPMGREAYRKWLISELARLEGLL